MKTEDTYSNLYNYCCRDEKDNPIWIKSVKRLLRNNPDLDLTKREGFVFSLAISNQSIKMLSILLNYYEQNSLQAEPDTLEYKVAKYKLATIIQDAADDYDLSEEMKNLLAPYRPGENDDTDMEEDFLDDKNLNFSSLSATNHEQKEGNYAVLTEDNLAKFTQEQEKLEEKDIIGRDATKD